MNPLQVIFALLGRVCISLLFIFAGLSDILYWQEAEHSLFMGLCDWVEYTVQTPWLQSMIESLVPMSSTLQIIAVIFKLLGGVLVLLGIKVRFGAFLLATVLIPATLLTHPFMMLQGSEMNLQLNLFLKNLSILGGLFLVLVFGTGPKEPKSVKTKSKD